MQKFIHVGAPAFDRKRFRSVENGSRRSKHTEWLSLKPFGGLWGTPEGNPEWDLFGSKSSKFVFGLEPEAKLLHIHCGEDLVKALRRRPSWDSREVWKYMASRWDAVWVHQIDCLTSISGWDVESIVVLNPDRVIEV
jgi:hypothetical protein